MAAVAEVDRRTAAVEGERRTVEHLVVVGPNEIVKLVSVFQADNLCSSLRPT